LELLLADLPTLNLKRVAFDTLTVVFHTQLTEKWKNTQWIPDRAIIWALRTIKSPEEIADIRKAAKFADEGQKTAAEIIKPGMREYEVAAEVEYAMRRRGSEDEGHRTMVTSGPRTVMGVESGYTTDRVIKEGEFVVVDTGATFNDYRTDLGRPYVAGKPTSKQKETYKLLVNAQEAAFVRVKPNVITGDLDVAAREVLGEYEKYFDHELGHGIGLTFEPPALGKNRTDVLKENMVITIEPGLYIDDFGGMILEDTILVTKEGAERLTAPPLDWD